MPFFRLDSHFCFDHLHISIALNAIANPFWFAWDSLEFMDRQCRTAIFSQPLPVTKRRSMTGDFSTCLSCRLVYPACEGGEPTCPSELKFLGMYGLKWANRSEYERGVYFFSSLPNGIILLIKIDFFSLWYLSELAFSSAITAQSAHQLSNFKDRLLPPSQLDSHLFIFLHISRDSWSESRHLLLYSQRRWDGQWVNHIGTFPQDGLNLLSNARFAFLPSELPVRGYLDLGYYQRSQSVFHR